MNCGLLMKVWKGSADSFTIATVASKLGAGARIVGIGCLGDGTNQALCELGLAFGAAPLLPPIARAAKTSAGFLMKWLGTMPFAEVTVPSAATANATAGGWPIAAPISYKVSGGGAVAIALVAAGSVAATTPLSITVTIAAGTASSVVVFYTLDAPSTHSIDVNG